MFENTVDKIRLLFRKDKESYLRFYRMLGFYPHDIQIYEQALLHKSLSVRSSKGLINNERLEFLGDAILDAVVADILYKKFEGKREGFLTNTRSKIVQRETLNRVAAEIGLDKLVKYTVRNSSHNCYMGGNAFEALIGAIYLDRGYRACKQFLETRIIGKYIDVEKISRKEMNFKSKFIEWSQKNRMQISFELISQSYDSFNSPVFESEVLIEGISAGKGTGYSKKESQQLASSEAIARIKKDAVFVDGLFAAKARREEQEGVKPEPEMVSEEQEAMPIETSIPVVEEEERVNVNDSREQIIRAAEDAAFGIGE